MQQSKKVTLLQNIKVKSLLEETTIELLSEAIRYEALLLLKSLQIDFDRLKKKRADKKADNQEENIGEKTFDPLIELEKLINKYLYLAENFLDKSDLYAKKLIELSKFSTIEDLGQLKIEINQLLDKESSSDGDVMNFLAPLLNNSLTRFEKTYEKKLKQEQAEKEYEEKMQQKQRQDIKNAKIIKNATQKKNEEKAMRAEELQRKIQKKENLKKHKQKVQQEKEVKEQEMKFRKLIQKSKEEIDFSIKHEKIIATKLKNNESKKDSIAAKKLVKKIKKETKLELNTQEKNDAYRDFETKYNYSEEIYESKIKYINHKSTSVSINKKVQMFNSLFANKVTYVNKKEYMKANAKKDIFDIVTYLHSNKHFSEEGSNLHILELSNYVKIKLKLETNLIDELGILEFAKKIIKIVLAEKNIVLGEDLEIVIDESDMGNIEKQICDNESYIGDMILSQIADNETGSFLMKLKKFLPEKLSIIKELLDSYIKQLHFVDSIIDKAKFLLDTTEYNLIDSQAEIQYRELNSHIKQKDQYSNSLKDYYKIKDKYYEAILCVATTLRENITNSSKYLFFTKYSLQMLCAVKLEDEFCDLEDRYSNFKKSLDESPQCYLSNLEKLNCIEADSALIISIIKDMQIALNSETYGNNRKSNYQEFQNEIKEDIANMKEFFSNNEIKEDIANMKEFLNSHTETVLGSNKNYIDESMQQDQEEEEDIFTRLKTIKSFEKKYKALDSQLISKDIDEKDRQLIERDKFEKEINLILVYIDTKTNKALEIIKYVKNKLSLESIFSDTEKKIKFMESIGNIVNEIAEKEILSQINPDELEVIQDAKILVKDMHEKAHPTYSFILELNEFFAFAPLKKLKNQVKIKAEQYNSKYKNYATNNQIQLILNQNNINNKAELCDLIIKTKHVFEQKSSLIQELKCIRDKILNFFSEKNIFSYDLIAKECDIETLYNIKKLCNNDAKSLDVEILDKVMDTGKKMLLSQIIDAINMLSIDDLHIGIHITTKILINTINQNIAQFSKLKQEFIQKYSTTIDRSKFEVIIEASNIDAGKAIYQTPSININKNTNEFNREFSILEEKAIYIIRICKQTNKISILKDQGESIKQKFQKTLEELRNFKSNYFSKMSLENNDEQYKESSSTEKMVEESKKYEKQSLEKHELKISKVLKTQYQGMLQKIINEDKEKELKAHISESKHFDDDHGVQHQDTQTLGDSEALHQ